MGFHVVYATVKGKSPEEILSLLRLEGTGEFEEFPDSHVVGARLRGGWYLVYVMTSMSNQYWSPLRYPGDNYNFPGKAPPPAISMTDQLRALSDNAEVILGVAEESSMQSFATCWRKGQEVWMVNHESGNRGREHFEFRGDFPSQFEQIKEDCFRLDKDPRRGDMLFEIPTLLVLSLTGFRYDGNNEGGHPTEEFEILKPLPPQKRWWQFWK